MDRGKFMVIVDSPFLSTGTFRLFLAFFSLLPADGPDLVCYLPGLVWCRLIATRLGITNELQHIRTTRNEATFFCTRVAMEEEGEEKNTEEEKARKTEEDWFSDGDFPWQENIFRLISSERNDEQAGRKNHDNQGSVIKEKNVWSRDWTTVDNNEP